MTHVNYIQVYRVSEVFAVAQLRQSMYLHNIESLIIVYIDDPKTPIAQSTEIIFARTGIYIRSCQKRI